MLMDGLYQMLSADAGVTTAVAGRIYPVILPSGVATPCITFQVASSLNGTTMDGRTATTRRVQFDAWGNDYPTMEAASSALHRCLDAYQGTLPDGTAVLSCTRGVEMDWYADDARYYRQTTEYLISYAE